MYVGAGFRGEAMSALPRPLVRTYLGGQPASSLIVSDAGYFPHAERHGMQRENGTEQLVVIVCTAGAGRFTTPHDTYAIQRGDIIVVPPGLPHAYFADTEKPWTILWFHAFGEAIPALLRASGMTAERPVAAVRDLYRVAALADEVLQHLKRDETQASILAAAGAAWHLLTSLPLQCHDRQRPNDAVDEVQALLRSRVGTRLLIADLARRVGLSSSHLSAIFRERTGQGILEYQTSLRMSRARELLDLTDAPINTIAREIGYPDALYFSRMFRIRQGMSPSDYRLRDNR